MSIQHFAGTDPGTEPTLFSHSFSSELPLMTGQKVGKVIIAFLPFIYKSLEFQVLFIYFYFFEIKP